MEFLIFGRLRLRKQLLLVFVVLMFSQACVKKTNQKSLDGKQEEIAFPVEIVVNDEHDIQVNGVPVKLCGIVKELLIINKNEAGKNIILNVKVEPTLSLYILDCIKDQIVLDAIKELNILVNEDLVKVDSIDYHKNRRSYEVVSIRVNHQNKIEFQDKVFVVSELKKELSGLIRVKKSVGLIISADRESSYEVVVELESEIKKLISEDYFELENGVKVEVVKQCCTEIGTETLYWYR